MLKSAPPPGTFCVTAAHRSGETAWPRIALQEAVFAAYLQRLREEEGCETDLCTWLSTRNGRDLWLACACYHQEEAALRVFEDEVLGPITPVLREMDKSGSALPEIFQRLRTKLFVSSATRGEAGIPKILGYAGKSSLQRWVRAVAIRIGLDLLRADARMVALSDDVEDGLVAEDGPEMEHLRRVYGAELKRAFEDVVAALSSKDRVLLRYHYSDGLDGTQIAEVLRVHATTITRRLVRIRGEIASETRRHLRMRLGVDAPQLRSIMRIVPSELELSLERLLDSTGG